MSTSAPVRTRPLSLLVVDDNRDCAESLCLILRNCGYNVSIAYDGKQAVQMVTDSAFNVILCDIGLPGRSGYEVAAEIRRLRGKAALVIAVSAYASEPVREHARSAGFDYFFSKPADPDVLKDLIQRHKSAAESDSTLLAT